MAQSGSWGGLRAAMQEAARERIEDKAAPPVACPNDGEPLEDARGVLHCPYDGWIWRGVGNAG